MKTRLMRALTVLLALLITVLSLAAASAATYPYETTSGDSVKLRRSASSSAVVLATISAGDTVTVLGKTGSYYKVKYKKYTGYAMVSYIDGASETLAPGATQAILSSVTSYPYSSSTVTRAKLRKSADMDAEVLTVVPQDALITVYSVTNNGFAKAKYAGKTGYLLTTLIVLGNIPTPTPVAEATVSPEASRYTNLKTGSTGGHVRALQEALTELGYYTAKVDSKYGSGTKAAVLAFEKKNGLTEDGEANGDLQLLLFEGRPRNSKGTRKDVKTVPLVAGATIKSADTGEAVENMQTRLKTLGYYAASVNGVCDKATVAAIKAFQTKMGIVSDGVATADVLTILYGATAVSSAEVVTPTPAPTAAPPTDTLRSGDSGSGVKVLQQRLIELGYYSGTVDGKFGDGTVKALKAFQKKNGLGQDGVCGAQTRTVLYGMNPIYATATAAPTPAPTIVITEATTVTIQSGSRGTAVLNLQKRLAELGYYTSRLDGVYLEDDIAAVRAFQKANGLTSDGKAGYLTQLALFSSTAIRGDMGNTAITATMRYGDSGSNITTLQNRLIELGYLVGTADGKFGASTKSALVAFQIANNLTRDGVAGEKTQLLLYSNAAVKNTVKTNTTLKPGTIGDAVKALQSRLIALGYLTGTADGNFGAKTSLALIAFQKNNGLSGDGIAGEGTLAKLNSMNAVSANGTTSSTGSATAPTLNGAPSASSVRYANWYTEVKPRCKLYPNATVYDFSTGLSWKVNMFSLGAHADSEPLTAADTANMRKAFGGQTTWTPKAVWVVFSDGRVYMASTHDTPHGTSHIRNNDFDGHLCIHFPRTAEQVAAIGSYATSHQKAIDLGWVATQARAAK